LFSGANVAYFLHINQILASKNVKSLSNFYDGDDSVADLSGFSQRYGDIENIRLI
jgi:hypothetical protein